MSPKIIRYEYFKKAFINILSSITNIILYKMVHLYRRATGNSLDKT